MQGEAQDAALELNVTEIAQKDRVDKVIDRFSQIYKKDKLTQKHNALEALKPYTRPPNVSVRDFLMKFDKRYHKTKNFGVTLSND